MPEQTAVSEVKKTGHIEPFVIEVSTKNSASWQFGLIGEKLRGKWSVHKQGSRAGSINATMRSMPDIPGLRISVKQNKDGGGTLEIYDPLKDDQELLDRINVVYNSGRVIGTAKFKAVPTQKKVVDKDMLVTFLWELRRIADGIPDGHTFEMVSGQLPTEREIESLPGRELNEAGSPYPHARYKDEVDTYGLFLQFQNMMKNRAIAT